MTCMTIVISLMLLDNILILIMSYLVWFVLTLLLKHSYSLKVLLTSPGGTKSQVLFNARLADVLITEGHEVHQLITHIAAKISHKHSDKISSMKEFFSSDEYPEWKNVTDYLTVVFAKMSYDNLPIMEIGKWMNSFAITGRYHCQLVLNVSSTLEQYRDTNFDVILTHVYGGTVIGLAEQLNIPRLWVSGGNYILEQNGVALSLPLPPSYVPSTMAACSDSMTFVQRLKTVILQSSMSILTTIFRRRHPEAECYHNLFPDGDHLSELAPKIPQLLLNGEQMIDFPRPVTSFVHYVGELAPNAFHRTLNNEWTNFVEGAEDGVILFSLGSVANTTLMPQSWRMIFLEAFAQFPTYRIIWKFNDQMPEAVNYTHIRLSPWVPQRELLSHSRLKLFITHGGYNSLLESCHSGIPLLMIPLFFDQHGNAQRAKRLGLARILDKMTMNSEVIAGEMGEMLTNEKYSQRAKFVSKVIVEHVASPHDMLIHRLKRGAIVNPSAWNHTLYAARRLNFVQYHSIDVVMSMITALCFVVVVVIYLFYVVFVNWCSD